MTGGNQRLILTPLVINTHAGTQLVYRPSLSDIGKHNVSIDENGYFIEYPIQRSHDSSIFGEKISPQRTKNRSFTNDYSIFVANPQALTYLQDTYRPTMIT